MKEKLPPPLAYAPPPSRLDAFERNGWIGLVVTLAVCASALALLAIVAVFRIVR